MNIFKKKNFLRNKKIQILLKREMIETRMIETYVLEEGTFAMVAHKVVFKILTKSANFFSWCNFFISPSFKVLVSISSIALMSRSPTKHNIFSVE